MVVLLIFLTNDLPVKAMFGRFPFFKKKTNFVGGYLPLLKESAEKNSDDSTDYNMGDGCNGADMVENEDWITLIENRDKIFLDNISVQVANNASSSSIIPYIAIINENSNSLLHQAVLENNLDLVREHIVSGADVNVLNDDEETPLHLAAKKGFLAIVEYLLLQEDIDPQMTDKYGSTARYRAYENGHVKVRDAIFAYFAPGGLWEQRGRK